MAGPVGLVPDDEGEVGLFRADVVHGIVADLPEGELDLVVEGVLVDVQIFS